MSDSVEQRLRNFIVENFLFGDENDGLGDSDSLLERGVIDSTGVLEMIAFLERTYGIHVDDDELLPENFDSIKNVADYIHRKQLTQA